MSRGRLIGAVNGLRDMFHKDGAKDLGQRHAAGYERCDPQNKADGEIGQVQN